MKVFEFFEILFLSRTASNAAAIAQNTALASMPEYVKEASFIAQGLYQQLRRDSAAIRFLRDLGMFITSIVIFAVWGIIPLVIALFLWLVVGSIGKAWAQQQAMAEAWAVGREKQMKEAAIREVMYDAAVSRLKLQ
jgi:hypothetical protein